MEICRQKEKKSIIKHTKSGQINFAKESKTTSNQCRANISFVSLPTTPFSLKRISMCRFIFVAAVAFHSFISGAFGVIDFFFII